MSAIPAAPAINGIAMLAPRRCTLGTIGSSPTKVILPPVSSGDNPSSCITERNSALMSNPVETLSVSNGVLVIMMLFLRGNWIAGLAKEPKLFVDLENGRNTSGGSVTAIFCTIIREESGDSTVPREFGWIVGDLEFSVVNRQPRDVRW